MSVSKNMMNHIYEIAQESRFPGSRGARIARGIITASLSRHDYEVQQHITEIPNWSITGHPLVEVIGTDITIRALPTMLSKPTEKQGVVGILEEIDPLIMLGSFPWSRLAIVNHSQEHVAYIISSSYEVKVQPVPKSSQEIPCVIVSFEDFNRLLITHQNNPDLLVRVINPSQISGKEKVISIITNSTPVKPHVLVCAHYDSTFNSAGALDNASGVAVALALAETAKKEKWPCNFAFFDGEELNQTGSTDFVNNLADSELEKISSVFEIDTVGSGNELVMLCSKKLSKPLKKAELDKFIPDNFKMNINPQSKITFCDVWPFMQKKIPVVRMLSRAPKGSGLGLDLIHTVDDTVDSVDTQTLEASFECSRRIIELLISKYSI